MQGPSREVLHKDLQEEEEKEAMGREEGGTIQQAREYLLGGRPERPRHLSPSSTPHGTRPPHPVVCPLFIWRLLS